MLASRIDGPKKPQFNALLAFRSKGEEAGYYAALRSIIVQNPRLIPQTDEKSALVELRARSSQENPEAGRALAYPTFGAPGLLGPARPPSTPPRGTAAASSARLGRTIAIGIRRAGSGCQFGRRERDLARS